MQRLMVLLPDGRTFGPAENGMKTIEVNEALLRSGGDPRRYSPDARRPEIASEKDPWEIP